MNTGIIIKDGTALDWMDAPIESKKWRILIFTKNGRSLRCLVLVTKEQAEHDIVEINEEMKQADPNSRWRTMDGVFSAAMYSHCIAVPVTE